MCNSYAICQKNHGKPGQKADFWNLRLKKSNTKRKIKTPWTLIIEPVDQDIAGSTTSARFMIGK